MPPSQWKESYRTHVNELDEQHMGLFDAVAKLRNAVERGEGEPSVRGFLFTLLDYTRSHFAAEEVLLNRVGYPELESHTREHEQFTFMLRKWLDAPSAVRAPDVLATLEKWLIFHVTQSDTAYVPYVLRDLE